MSEIKQYRPAFFEGFENVKEEFNSLDELVNLKFVKNFRYPELFDSKENPDFHQFSISKHGDVFILMAEFKGGSEWWVVGYIYDDAHIKELPNWEPKKEGAYTKFEKK